MQRKHLQRLWAKRLAKGDIWLKVIFFILFFFCVFSLSILLSPSPFSFAYVSIPLCLCNCLVRYNACLPQRYKNVQHHHTYVGYKIFTRISLGQESNGRTNRKYGNNHTTDEIGNLKRMKIAGKKTNTFSSSE